MSFFVFLVFSVFQTVFLLFAFGVVAAAYERSANSRLNEDLITVRRMVEALKEVSHG